MTPFNRRRPLAALVACALAVSGGTLVGVAGLATLSVGPAAAATPCGPKGSFAVTGLVVTCTYSSVGTATFTVPENDNVTSVTVAVIGGGGGGGQSNTNGPHSARTGGSGAKVTAHLTGLAATEVLPVVVGGGGGPAKSNPSSGGGGASSVLAGKVAQVIAGGGGGGGNTKLGGSAGHAGQNGTGCTVGGGGAGGGGTGGAGGKSTNCNTPTGTAPSGGNGSGGAGGSGRDGGDSPVAGGYGTGTGKGGTSNTFSGAGGGGYGGGGGGVGTSGGGGGGSTGGAVTLANNGGKGEATPTTTPFTTADFAQPGGNGSVKISYELPPVPKAIHTPSMTFTGATGTHATCSTKATDWTTSVPIDEYRYQWVKNGVTVIQGPGTTTAHYTLSRAANAGSSLQCEVSASNITGPSAFASSYAQGFAAVPTNVTPPTLSSGGFVGEAVECGTLPKDWTNTPTLFKYQFLVTGTAAGPYQTTNTISITSTLAGKTITCRVEAYNAPWPSTPVTSPTVVHAHKGLIVTAPSPTVPYGTPVPTLTPKYTGLLPGTSLPATPPTCVTTPPHPTQVGTYPVTCSGAVDSRYTYTYVAGKLTITAVPLVVTAPSATLVTGKPAPTLTPTYTGFVGGDTASSLKAAPVCTTTYSPGGFPLPTPGMYPVTCTGAADPNYTISYVAGTLAVGTTYLPGAYDLADEDGGVYSLNNPHGFHGSLPGIGITVNNIVAIVSTPDHKGYWLVGRDGGVFAFGDAVFYGSLPGLGLTVSDIVGAVATPDGAGYWLVGKDGGVFAFGDATFYGSLPSKGVSASDVVGIAATPTAKGYWLAESSGTVDPMGGAPTLGGAPGGGVVSITSSWAGKGYWLASSIGGVVNRGNAPFEGSLPGLGLTTDNIVSLVPSGTGAGYLMTGADGSNYAFPNAVFPGPLGGVPGAPVIGAAPSA